MNLSETLTRISAVVWTFVSMFSAVVMAIQADHRSYAMLAPLFAFGMHWGTAWIVRKLFGHDI